MVTPAIDPIWVRNASIESFGATVDMHNYADIGTVDPNTDLTAEKYGSLADQSQAMQKTIPFAIVNLTCNDASPAAPTINTYHALHGVARPTVARIGTGHFTITWATSYLDSFGQSGATNLTDYTACIHGSVSALATAQFTSVNVLEVFVFTPSTGSALADKKLTVVVY